VEEGEEEIGLFCFVFFIYLFYLFILFIYLIYFIYLFYFIYFYLEVEKDEKIIYPFSGQSSMPAKPKPRRRLRRENEDGEDRSVEQRLACRIRRVLNIPNIRVDEISNIIYREIKPYIKDD
jgi:hypothetical protein